jgi:hypothetical protein
MASITTVGAGMLAVLSLFAGVFVSIALALLLSVRSYRGFRRTRSQRLLALSGGLLLIVAVPKVANLALATATAISTPTIGAVTAACRVVGLATILVTIYARE